MTDDWMTPEHKAAALEGFMGNPVAKAYARAMAEVDQGPSLAEWLLEQIAEDERVAREVSAVELAGAIVPGTNGGVGPRWDAKDGMVFAEGITWDGIAEGLRGTLLWDARRGRVTSSFAAVHMARWDPARVLAECDAKRQIVAVHRSYTTTDVEKSGVLRRCYVCASVQGYGNGVAIQEPAPCPTLRLLALPYADREGYREEWAI